MAARKGSKVAALPVADGTATSKAMDIASALDEAENALAGLEIAIEPVLVSSSATKADGGGVSAASCPLYERLDTLYRRVVALSATTRHIAERVRA